MDDENSYRAWLPPEDRLWRHPSEAANEPNPRDARNDDRDSTVERPSVPRNLGRWFHNPWARTGAVAVVAGIVGALVVSAVGVLAGAFEQQTTVVRSAVPTAPSLTLASTAGNGLNWSGVDDAVAPSVVDVQVTTASGPVSGSGLLFEPGIGKSYVLTDSSLVAGASDIQVAVMGNQQYSGKVVGSDSLSGLAVLAVVMPTWPPTFLQVGSAADLKLGDPVMAVGAGADACLVSVHRLGRRRRPRSQRDDWSTYRESDRGERFLAACEHGRRRSARRSVRPGRGHHCQP